MLGEASIFRKLRVQIEPLPPLNTLIAFECVARYCSFSRAADELNLTQSAISRQILQLEEMLGCKLFTRSRRQVSLTPRGEAFAAEIRKSLGDISHSTAEVMGWSGLPQVTLACTSAMGQLWLSSRLSRLRESLPDLQIRLKISDSFSSLKTSEFDMAIFYLREAPEGFHAEALFDEICYPMCSPAFAKTLSANITAEEVGVTGSAHRAFITLRLVSPGALIATLFWYRLRYRATVFYWAGKDWFRTRCVRGNWLPHIQENWRRPENAIY
jgi:DNA-binding transcriptional LysR family regulator